MGAEIGSDAERLQEIQALERAIQAKSPDLAASRSQVESARKVEAERRQKITEIDRQIKRVGDEIHRRGSGVYLNGQTLDRGNLMLGNVSFRFVGWRGKVEIDLQHIRSIDIGTSHLPSRAGIPLIQRVLPGITRPQETLLITVQESNTAAPRLAVIAAIDNAQAWLAAFHTQQERLSDVHAHRDNLTSQLETARLAWDDSKRLLKVAQSALTVVESEIAELRNQQNKLKFQQFEIDRARAQAAKNAGRKQ